MKNRFNRMFSLFCAITMLICAVSAWALAESPVATPTDLTPEEAEPADSLEIIVNKTLTINESWEGRMKNTKPAILKLDLDKAQTVYMLVEGRDVWATVEKTDRITENPARHPTNPETEQLIYSWEAEAGCYLITLGPVEPNLLAMAKVTFMDTQTYEAWEAEQAESKAEEESDAAIVEASESQVGDEPENIVEEQEAGSGEEPESEIEKETKPETEEAKETTEQKNENLRTHEKSEIEDKESADIPDDETMLNMGFIKVQVLKENGADLYNNEEMIMMSDHMAFGTELWIKPINGKDYAILYAEPDAIVVQYISTDDVLIVLQKEETGEQAAQEDDEKAENEPEKDVEEEQQIRSLKLSSSLNRINGFIAYGTPILLEAELVNFREDDEYSCQWQYSADGENYTDIENANELTYTYPISEENFNYIWKLIVMLKETE